MLTSLFISFEDTIVKTDRRANQHYLKAYDSFGSKDMGEYFIYLSLLESGSSLSSFYISYAACCLEELYLTTSYPKGRK